MSTAVQQSKALAFLRIAIGLLFLIFAEYKLTSTRFIWGGMASFIHGFLVRKAEKTHGTGRKIEGFLKKGAHVVIVDDVCTTGGSTITAIESTREAGMHVAAVLCLVDREQGGRANIEATIPGIPFLSVFTATDVRAAHIALHPKK